MKIVVYTAVWCGPCNTLKSTFKRKNIEYTEIDIDGNLKEADEAGISGVPTIVLTDDTGEEVRLIGFNSTVMKRVQGILDSGVAV